MPINQELHVFTIEHQVPHEVLELAERFEPEDPIGYSGDWFTNGWNALFLKTNNNPKYQKKKIPLGSTTESHILP